MFTIGKLAKATNLTSVAIRHYEKIGLLESVTRSGGGYRVYSEEDVARLKFIDNAKQMGFSLDKIKQLLNIQDNNLSSQLVKNAVIDQIKLIEAKIESLQSLKSSLEEISSRCDGSKNVNDCPIIESIKKHNR